MRTKRIIQKPDLSMYFNAMPLIGLWLKADYEKANTGSAMIDLAHQWLNESERTTNQTRKKVYASAGQYLYSILTGHSYESNLNIEQ